MCVCVCDISPEIRQLIIYSVHYGIIYPSNALFTDNRTDLDYLNLLFSSSTLYLYNFDFSETIKFRNKFNY